MIKKIEKYYTKTVNTFGKQYRKRTTYWLLFIIPIYVTDIAIKGDYER